MSLRKKGGVDPCPPSVSQGPLFDPPQQKPGTPTPAELLELCEPVSEAVTEAYRRGLIGRSVACLALKGLAKLAEELKGVQHG